MLPYSAAPLVQAAQVAHAQSAPSSFVSGVTNNSTREGLMPNSDSMAPDYFQSLLGEADVCADKLANFNKMKDAFTHIARRKDGLKQSVQQLHERVNTLETTRDFVNSEFDYMARENPRLWAQKASLEQRVAALETDNQGLQGLCSRLDTENQELKKASALQDTRINNQDKLINNQANMINDKAKLISDQAKQIKALLKTNADQAKTNADQAKTIDTLSNNVATLQKAVDLLLTKQA